MALGVSRAYYCAYHAVKDYVLAYEGWSPPMKEDSHWSLIRHVREIRAHSKLHLKVAKDLADLRLARTQADYEHAPGLLQAKGVIAVSDARAILGLVDDLRRRRDPRST